ncbi:MAG: hypothetical protein CM15mP58_00090 [Burkholderiaceae bacterium]|nr:MAG: hypothetical protein CM15mP58_00090 [Burkholderiaceae bacterium]
MKFSINFAFFPNCLMLLLMLVLIGKQLGKEHAEIECINPRDFAENSYGCIDKRPFGGGPGMIMMAEPLKKSIIAISKKHLKSNLVVINFSPCGQKLDQTLIEEFVSNRGDNNRRHCLICGRYEGIDERFIEKICRFINKFGRFYCIWGRGSCFCFSRFFDKAVTRCFGNKSQEHMILFGRNFTIPHYQNPTFLNQWRSCHFEIRRSQTIIFWRRGGKL